jgi:hypothetical protein
MLGGDASLAVMTADERRKRKGEFAQQTEAIRHQLKRMEACTVHPFGKRLKNWDQVTIAALLWVAFVTPFEVGLLPSSSEPGMEVLFVCNQIIDIIFIFDICIQFFVPFRNKEGLWVMENKLMAKRYLLSPRPSRSFGFDVVSTVPYDTIINAFNSSADNSKYRGLKVLRIVKLVRVLRVSRIYKRWEAQLGINHTTLKMVEFLVLSLVMAHWLACKLAMYTNPTPLLRTSTHGCTLLLKSRSLRGWLLRQVCGASSVGSATTK